MTRTFLHRVRIGWKWSVICSTTGATIDTGWAATSAGARCFARAAKLNFRKEAVHG